MKLLSRRWFSLGLLLCVSFIGQVGFMSRANAGAWNKPQWGYFVQLGTAFSFTPGDANARFDGNGDRRLLRLPQNYNSLDRRGTPTYREAGDRYQNSYQSLMTDLYFELALLNRLSVFGDIAFVSARQSNEGGNISYRSQGIGDLMFGARVSILEKPVALALEGRFYAPTGDSLSIVPLGTGDFRGEIRGAIGKAWGELRVPVYIEAELGVTFRGTGDTRDYDGSSSPTHPIPYQTRTSYAPEIAVHGELGITAVRVKRQDYLLLSLGLDYRGSTRQNTNDAASAGGSITSLTPETQEFTMLNLNALVFVWKGLGISLRGNQVVEGKRALFLTTFYGGVFASF